MEEETTHGMQSSYNEHGGTNMEIDEHGAWMLAMQIGVAAW